MHHAGSYVPRACSLNFNKLGWEPRNLAHLDQPFTEEEVKQVILSAPKEKAPGFDEFIGFFFSSCWEILKAGLMLAIQQFYSLNQQDLHYLNQAFVVLIPKVQNPHLVSQFTPISLSHSFAKIISKLLANRLSEELCNMISINQTAFIRKRCIKYNFMYVHQVIKDLYRRKIPALFMKLDISKAFDIVTWPYLPEVMAHLGFGSRWTNWVVALWCTSSSCYLLNGQPGRRVLHCRGVRQGTLFPP
jgi:hypothetical protein